MSEIFKKLPPLVLSAALSLIALKDTSSQSYQVPKDCLGQNGPIDLRKCQSNYLQIPLETLNRIGYYNLSGVFEPHLPTREMQYFDAGLFLEGKIYAMNEEYAQSRKNELATKWGLNPDNYTGAIALGTARYVNTAVWIQNPLTGHIEGPLLDIEYSHLAHMRNYFCQGIIGDVSRQAYENLTFNQPDAPTVKIIVQSSDNLTTPDFNSTNTYNNLALSWLQNDGWSCNSN